MNLVIKRVMINYGLIKKKVLDGKFKTTHKVEQT